MIYEINDTQVKSVLLAKAMGWETGQILWNRVDMFADGYEPEYREIIYYRESNNTSREVHDLYDPANMALAWQVLNWASDNESMGQYHAWWGDVVKEPMWFIVNQYLGSMVLGKLPPADVQRLWLDKILELAVETGIVEVDDDL